MRSLPWPEMESKLTPGRTVRWLLDYLCWISREMRQIGFHAGAERDEWCQRVQTAYTALFIPMIPGHGDPYPPDVPPARNPGIWPDIPSNLIPGMTLRHQLTVMEMLGRTLRQLRWPHARQTEIAEWDRRIVIAYEALDHGDTLPLPEDEQSEPSKEAMQEAEAAARALQERARRRSQQLRKQMQKIQADAKVKEQAAQERTAKRKAAKGRAAAKKKAPAKKKAAPKKKKTTAKRKAAPKKKTTAKRKAAPKKKTTAKRKAAPKKKATTAKRK